MQNLIKVSADFVIAALEDRYEAVESKWGCEASEALWVQVLDLVKGRGLGEDVTSPSIYVNDYLIKGEFVSKDNSADWLDKTSFADYCEHHNLDEQEIDDLKNSPMFVEFWDEFCQDNALIYNDGFACLRF